MPVTFSIAAQPASVVHHSIVDSITWTPAVYVDQLLKVPIPQQVDDLISSSILDADLSNIIVRNNGLIDTVLLAWGQHHNLVIRPDDLWIAILTQLNFYVNKHAEEMRHYFVAHEEKQKLIVKSSMDTFTANWGDLAQKMTSQIEVSERWLSWNPFRTNYMLIIFFRSLV